MPGLLSKIAVTCQRRTARSRSKIHVALCTPVLAALMLGACATAERKPLGTLVKDKTETPILSSPPATSRPMPPFNTNIENVGWTLLDGRQTRLGDYRGSVVVLDFYATWCPPCRDEIPHLASLQTRFGKEGLKVIGLNVGGEEDRPKIPDFVETLGVNYQLGVPTPEAVDLYMGADSAIPQTLVFSRSGELLRHFTGYDATVRRELETTIAEAIAEEEGDE